MFHRNSTHDKHTYTILLVYSINVCHRANSRNMIKCCWFSYLVTLNYPLLLFITWPAGNQSKPAFHPPIRCSLFTPLTNIILKCIATSHQKCIADNQQHLTLLQCHGNYTVEYLLLIQTFNSTITFANMMLVFQLSMLWGWVSFLNGVFHSEFVSIQNNVTVILHSSWL